MTGEAVPREDTRQDRPAAGDPLRAVTWRELLIEVTEQLRHASPAALDAPVMVQVPGRLAPLESVFYDNGPDDDAVLARLVLYPWLVQP